MNLDQVKEVSVKGFLSESIISIENNLSAKGFFKLDQSFTFFLNVF